MFDEDPRNRVVPSKVPMTPMGRVPVIVRLEFPSGELYVPARAIRWTREHVMVMWTPDENEPAKELSIWLAASDVLRSIPGDRIRPRS